MSREIGAIEKPKKKPTPPLEPKPETKVKKPEQETIKPTDFTPLTPFKTATSSSSSSSSSTPKTPNTPIAKPARKKAKKDYSSVFDSVATSLGLTKNPRAYAGFRTGATAEFTKQVEDIMAKDPTLTITQAAKAFVRGGGGKGLKSTFETYLEETNQTPELNEPIDESKRILRARYDVAPPSAVAESVPEQVADTAQAELFTYVPPGEELGENNTLFLHDRLNDEIRFAKCNEKVMMNEPNVLGFNSEFNDQQYYPVKEDFNMLIENQSGGKLAASTQPFSILPNSNLQTTDPLNGVTQTSYWVAGAPQPGPMMRDTNYALPVGFSNYLGFAPWNGQARTPMFPSVQPGPDANYEQQLHTAFFLGPQIY